MLEPNIDGMVFPVLVGTTSFCGIGNLLSILLTSINCEQPNLQYKNYYITYMWVMLRVDSEAKATESRRVDLEGFWHANSPTSYPSLAAKSYFEISLKNTGVISCLDQIEKCSHWSLLQ